MKYTFFLCLAAFIWTVSAADKPNILYLYVDDMGWGSIGPNGQAQRKANGKPYVLTPNLDRLAEAGVNFRRAYGCTVCSPARSSQQTGFHQGYTFADRNDPNNAKKAIRAEDLTMGDLLLRAGYTTGYWGKWGYGGSADKISPTLDNLQTLPTSHGYQHVVAELHHVRAHTFFQPTLWTAPSSAKGGLELKANSLAKYINNKAYPNYPAVQNHPDYPKVAYCDDTYAFAALDFIRKQAVNYKKTGKPFFGLFAAQIPHAPFAEVAKLPAWDQPYKDKAYFAKLKNQSKQWCAMVTRIDAHFGNLLDALEDPNGDGDKSDSVAADTLVIFQSDNGGPGGDSRTELNANGGLSGSKGSIMEGGIRVPTIMSWPAKINAKSKLKAGTDSDMVIDCTDLLPTFCDLAGIAPPVGLSGVSIAPVLTGKGEQRTRDFLIHEAGGNASIIRGKYKLVRSRTSKKNSKKSKNKKNNNAKMPKTALYDLDKDPAEKNNLAQKFPELVEELNALLTAEYVDKPAGFANTYHQWLGTKGSLITSAGNWSEYVYKNAGVEYMSEGGAPKAYWSAKMVNGKPAVADRDVEFLGLEIGGGKASQSLTITSGATVSGRNELRVANQGSLILDGGSASSLRWIDVLAGGVLKGHGTIKASLYCQGTLVLSMEKPLLVEQNAVLGGNLTLSESVQLKSGQIITLLKAKSVSGKFVNKDVSVSGKRCKIRYNANTVTLSVD